MIVRVSDSSFLLPEMQTFYISHCIGHQSNIYIHIMNIYITLCVHVLGNIEQFEKSFMLLVH